MPCRCLLDHLVGNGQQSWGHREAKLLRLMKSRCLIASRYQHRPWSTFDPAADRHTPATVALT
jgi:hypothetical protein